MIDNTNPLDSSYEARLKRKMRRWRWQSLHLDPMLLALVLILCGFGLFILYSASNETLITVQKQAIRIILGLVVMIGFAQVPPQRYYQWTPTVYVISGILLLAVLFLGQIQQGARRWFDLHLLHLQPSEIMKMAMPMMMAWFLSKQDLPPRLLPLMGSAILLLTPVLLIAKQPDLGTALMVGCSGFSILLLGGIRWRLVFAAIVTITLSFPLLWHHMHQYQRERVLTFLNPERDPLGSGYHIIQSKIAIGSGGVFGKGWLNGTQSHLSFLPEHTTDFIFAVSGEELGLIGGIFLLLLYLAIVARCLYISAQAQNTYTRLLAGGLGLTFIAFAFINIGMVIGMLPVVGVPLPLISYGGSSMLTFMAGFGIIMSIQTHRKLWGS